MVQLDATRKRVALSTQQGEWDHNISDLTMEAYLIRQGHRGHTWYGLGLANVAHFYVPAKGML